MIIKRGLLGSHSSTVLAAGSYTMCVQDITSSSVCTGMLHLLPAMLMKHSDVAFAARHAYETQCPTGCSVKENRCLPLSRQSSRGHHTNYTVSVLL